MIDYNILIRKSLVVDEVKKTSAYIGKKLTNADDPGAFERVALVDANEEQLDRYWTEACSAATLALSHWQIIVKEQPVHAGDDYNVTLRLPDNWNATLGSSLQAAVASYLENMMLTQWLMLVDRADVESHTALAARAMAEVGRIILERVRPVRRPRPKPGSDVVTDDRCWHDELRWYDINLWLE